MSARTEKALVVVEPGKRRVNSRSPEQWAEIIRDRWQDRGIFEIAMLLEAAKVELGDDFPKMYRDELGWSKAMVSRLLAIAQSDHFAEVSHAKLPPKKLPTLGTLRDFLPPS